MRDYYHCHLFTISIFFILRIIIAIVIIQFRAVESEFKSNPIFPNFSEFPILSNFLSDFILFLSNFYPIFSDFFRFLDF